MGTDGILYKDSERVPGVQVTMNSDGEVDFRYADENRRNERVSGEEREIVKEETLELRKASREDAFVRISAWANNQARNALLNRLFQGIDRSLGDYSFGVPGLICKALGKWDGNWQPFKQEGRHLKTNEEYVDEYARKLTAHIRASYIAGMWAEIVEDELYRYEYTMRIAFDRPGVQWETFLYNDCADFAGPSEEHRVLHVWQGTSEERYEVYVNHFAGLTDEDDEDITLAGLECDYSDEPDEYRECRFNNACVWFRDEGTEEQFSRCVLLKDDRGRTLC